MQTFFFSVCAHFCSKSSKAKYLNCSDTQFSKTNKTLSMHARHEGVWGSEIISPLILNVGNIDGDKR